MSSPALHLVLELARASNAAEPNDVADREWNRYLLRWPDDSGRYEEGELLWDDSTKLALAAAGDSATAEAAIDKLGAVMRSLADAARWPNIAARIHAARARGRAVAITLRSAAHELYALPWELLDIAGAPLYATDDCLLRYTVAGEATTPSTPPPSLRVLVVSAAAGGGVPIAEHVGAITAAARASCVPFHPERDVIPGATYDDLSRALCGAPVSVLHLLCHGEALPGGGGFGLRLDPGRGPVTPTEMAELLKPHVETLRLVVIAACFGAAPAGIDHALDNVAQKIQAVGIPAVVASRYLLTSSGSTELTRVLYEQLWTRKASLPAAFLASRTALRVRRRGPDEHSDVDAMALQLHGGEVPSLEFRPWIFRPYRGLSAYDHDDASFFFGREDDRAALLQLVATALASSVPRFVLVAGASGTGKSSVVRAGLVPDLEAGKLEQARGWISAVVRPGEGGSPINILTRLDLPHSNEGGGAALALVVDQLEEIFTEVDRDDDRAAFLREIWRLACEPGGRVFVIATVRLEYMGRLGGVLMDAAGTPFDRVMLAAGRYHLLRQLGPDEYERIIRCPAELAGLQIERGLVESLLEGLRTSPGALPLLSFALDRLWQERSFQTLDVADPDEPARRIPVTGWWLTHAAYAGMGEIAGALAHSADQLLAALTPAETNELRRVLVQLVHGDDDSLLVTRRRGWRDQMRPDPVADAESARCYDRVLDRWIRERLLVSGTSAPDAPVWIELAHDSLIRLWPTFRKWYADARAWLGYAAEILADAAAWRAHGGDDQASYLLRGQRLGYHLETWERYRHQLGARDRELAQAFLEASRVAEAEARAREVEAERRSAVAEERAIAARDMAIMYAALQLRDAGQAAWATKLLAEVSRPLLTPGWLSFAWEQLGRTPLASTLRLHGATIHSAVFSPDSAFVLTVSDDGNARLWRADGRGEPRVLGDHPAPVTSAVFSPDGALVLTGADDGIARIWHVDGAAPPVLYQDHDLQRPDGAPEGFPFWLWSQAITVLDVSFSPDGQRFVAAAGTSARIWRIDQPQQGEALRHDYQVFSASFSPDSTRVVTLCVDGAARLWFADGRAPPAELRHPATDGIPHGVGRAWFPSDGRYVVTCGNDDTALIWPLDNPARPRVLQIQGDVLAFSPRGERLVSASTIGGPVRIWSLALPERNPDELGLPGQVTCAAFNPDGRLLATALSDIPSGGSPKTTIHLWKLPLQLKMYSAVLSGHDASVSTLAFSADSRHLVSTSSDGTARIWRVEQDLAQPEIMAGARDLFLFDTTLGPTGAVMCAWLRVTDADRTCGRVRINGTVVPAGPPSGSPLHLGRAGDLDPPAIVKNFYPEYDHFAFSSDGRRAVTGTRDGEVRVWSLEAAGSGPAMTFTGHENRIVLVSFSPDSKRVISGSVDDTARVWSLDERDEAMVLEHERGVAAAALSRDGRLAATGSYDGTARVWLLAERRGLHTFCLQSASGAPCGRVTAVAFDRDAEYLLAQGDGLAQVWRLNAGEQQAPIIHEKNISAAAFSRDGTRILLASADGTAQIVHLADPGRSTIFNKHANCITAAVFSSDDQWIATGSDDSTARVWRVADPAQFMVLHHPEPVTSVQFSADSTQLLTRSDRNHARLWTIGVDTLCGRLRSASTDCLPSDLRQRHLGETEAEAQKHYEDCEHGHGRTPRPG